ncbi:MAG: transcription elongation factor GreA [Candidatus Taylorbacteria bacterium]
MSDQKEYLSKAKFETLNHELEHLKKIKRKEVAEDLEYAKSLGDLAENAEYHEARELQASIEDRILKLESILNSAVIMTLHHSEAVGVGSTLIVEREGELKKYKFEMVGSEESDVNSGKLSIHSPLGSAMMGKKKGESFSFQSPKGSMNYKILSIE